MKIIAPLFALALASACSPATETTPQADATTEAAAPAAEIAPEQPSDPQVLALEGLGDLRIGAPVPAGSSFAPRGAQIPGSCQTVSSPDYPGVYAMTIDGTVKRITVSTDSPVALVEGIGAGATEADVRAAFPSFVESPHKYVDAPAKYLTQPGEDPRLRFEIDAEGKASLIHVGVMPELAWVEGCA